MGLSRRCCRCIFYGTCPVNRVCSNYYPVNENEDNEELSNYSLYQEKKDRKEYYDAFFEYLSEYGYDLFY